MPELTPRQSEVLDCIRRHITSHGYPPTVRELCELLGITSGNGVMCHLKSLKAKGVIDWTPGAARSIRVLGASPVEALQRVQADSGFGSLSAETRELVCSFLGSVVPC